MKKLLIISIIVLFSPLWGDGSGVAQSKVFIPDTNFRNFLNTNYPTFMDSTGDSLVTATAATLTGQFNCFFESIADLTGVEYFINITVLNCSSNLLTALPALDSLNSLEKLICNSNLLTALPALDSLSSLETLICTNNQLTVLPGLPGSVQYLYCGSNQLTALPDLSANTLLFYLDCPNNQLTALPDLLSNTFLSYLECSDNQLNSFPDLSAHTILQTLNCGNNQLTALPDLSANTALQRLECHNNQLTNIPSLSANTALQYFHCFDNQLTVLPDLSANTALVNLICRNNQLDFSDARELRIADTISTLTTFTYSPQNPFGPSATFNLASGDTLTMSIVSQDSALSYQWFKGTDTITGATDTLLMIPNITTADSGVYACRSYGTALQTPPMIYTPGISEFVSEPIMVNVSMVGVEESNALSSIIIYPNPSNGQFTVEITSQNRGKVELKIIDLLGKETYSQSIPVFHNVYQQELDINEYGTGIYLLTLKTKEGTQTKRIIIQ